MDIENSMMVVLLPKITTKKPLKTRTNEKSNIHFYN
jgi:hypothetical protein